jgi:hypothetical protein
MNNDIGNITSIGLVFFLAIISIGSISLIKKSNDIKKHKEVFMNFLCVKEAHGVIAQHKETIELTNNIIRIANLGQMIGLFTNPTILIGSKRAKELTQKSQAIYHISFLEKIRSLFTQSCIFTPNIAKTHFETTSVLILERDKSGVVKRRREKWEFSSINKSSLIKSTLTTKTAKTSTTLY